MNDVPKIVLIGNPNSGKTSLFNALTGANQKVGNYAGVTVEKISGTLFLSDQEVEIMDVPGIYSINPISIDERVAIRSLEKNPALILYVIDATNLERNLFLYSQLVDRGQPIVVALTMNDILENHQQQINCTELAEHLGCLVYPVVPHKKQGIEQLKEGIRQTLTNPSAPIIGLPVHSELTSLTAVRYEWAAQVRKHFIRDELTKKIKKTTDKIDSLLTHRIWGLLIFSGLMWMLFQCIYTLAEPLKNGIDHVIFKIEDKVKIWLKPWPVLESMVTEGILQGVGNLLSFLPQICILFFFISLLESSGYLARAAFLMDKLLGWCGLNGRAFIPLLSSFACAIPGVMATRVIPDQKSRLATLLVAPLMSCSARLPVYILMISTFIEPQYGAFVAGLTLFGMHLLGLFVAVPIVWVFNKKFFRTQTLPFIFELPSYQKPIWKDVFFIVYNRAKTFMFSAGTTILTLSIILWGLLHFPQNKLSTKDLYEYDQRSKTQKINLDQFEHQKQIERSYLGQVSQTVAPLFHPAGFDWRLTTAILSAFPAREVVVSSLGILFGLDGEVNQESKDLRKRLVEAKWPSGEKLITPSVAFGFMGFFALCCQCMSTLAAIKRETGTWKWPLFIFTYMSLLAYGFAVLLRFIEKWIRMY